MSNLMSIIYIMFDHTLTNATVYRLEKDSVSSMSDSSPSYATVIRAKSVNSISHNVKSFLQTVINIRL